MRTAIIAALGVLLLLAGCSAKEEGTPSGYSSSGTTELGTTSGSTKPNSTTNTPSLGLPAGFDACDVLNAVSAELNLTEVQRDEPARTVDPQGRPIEPNLLECGAEYPADTSVWILISEGSIDNYNPPNPAAIISDLQLNAKKAKKIEKHGTNASCVILVQLNSDARVAFGAATNTSLPQACDAVARLATTAEPKLP